MRRCLKTNPSFFFTVNAASHQNNENKLQYNDYSTMNKLLEIPREHPNWRVELQYTAGVDVYRLRLIDTTRNEHRDHFFAGRELRTEAGPQMFDEGCERCALELENA